MVNLWVTMVICDNGNVDNVDGGGDNGNAVVNLVVVMLVIMVTVM